MIPLEQAILKDILLGMVTNSEVQAMQWAKQILDALDEQKCEINIRDFTEHG